MDLIKTVKDSRLLRLLWQREDRRVSLVPTMGALHAGHLSLIRRAKEMSDRVVVSVFVNPTQFGPNEDYRRYPRSLDHDLNLLEKHLVDAVFVPEVSEIYPSGYSTYVTVDGLSQKLCGKSRPIHFRGVTTVVCKLLTIWSPHLALFGWKDAQQCIVIRRMVEDLCLPVEIVACPIVRESDGLALSSRNAYLSPEERNAATQLYRSLQWAKEEVTRGESSAKILLQGVEARLLAEPLIKLDYAEIVDIRDLRSLEVITADAMLALAAYVGNTRLIDNTLLQADMPISTTRS